MATLLENPAKKATKKSVKKVTKGKTAKGKTAKKERHARPKSKSGKFPSIRKLMESLLGQKTMDFDKAMATVKKEFPDSAFSKKHYSWYVYQIIRKNA